MDALPLTRRTVVAAGALALVRPARVRALGSPAPLVVDAHVHCFAGTGNPRFPYNPDGSYQPEVAATPQQFLACMTAGGVNYAVLVHPEPYLDDHRYLEYCLGIGKGRLKGTCLFVADRPAWKTALPALVKKNPIVALRIHAYRADRLPPFGKPELRALWKAAADLGLAIQLHFEPHFAQGFEPLIKEFAQTPVIIDHLGRPMQATTEEHALVLRWAKLPNTYMKLSAVPEATEYPFRDPKPIIRDLIAAYGPSRMLSGGGFGAGGATPEGYRTAREHLRSFVGHLSASDQAQIFGGTAARLFGFPIEATR